MKWTNLALKINEIIITVVYMHTIIHKSYHTHTHIHCTFVGIHRGAVSGHSSECACHLCSTHQWQLHKPSQVSEPLSHFPTQPNCK